MKNEKIIEELYDQMMAELNSEYKELSSSTANQQDYFGAYVVPITSSMFETIPIWKRIGRLIQVRKKAGSYGSDIFTLRLIDASITPWENESFWIVPEEYKARLDEVFEASIFCDNWDNPIENSIGIVGIDYCDNPDKRYIGFIIPAELTDEYLYMKEQYQEAKIIEESKVWYEYFNIKNPLEQLRIGSKLNVVSKDDELLPLLDRVNVIYLRLREQNRLTELFNLIKYENKK